MIDVIIEEKNALRNLKPKLYLLNCNCKIISLMTMEYCTVITVAQENILL